jgi:hypothetical protein
MLAENGGHWHIIRPGLLQWQQLQIYSKHVLPFFAIFIAFEEI